MLKLLGLMIIVNFKDWGISRSKYDLEIGPILIDWEDVVVPSLKTIKRDLRVLYNLSTGPVQWIRPGGVWSANVSDDIRYANGQVTRAWNSLPASRAIAWIAFWLFPENYQKCLKAMGKQARGYRHTFSV